MLTIHTGDCRLILSSLPDASVQMCVTSPPYWGLRNYGVDGQLGLEASPAAYVASLVGVLHEVQRILRPDGVLWLNLGDSYFGDSPARTKSAEGFSKTWNPADSRGNGGQRRSAARDGSLRPKSLIGIPWRVAFALQDDGWILRSDVIWSKPNCMPESVTDRPTRSHEYMFLLSKSPRYYYDAEAIKETSRTPAGLSWEERKAIGPTEKNAGVSWRKDVSIAQSSTLGDGLARNKRTVWEVSTTPYAGQHFATFPVQLIEPCVLAGSSPQACEICGAPWQRMTQRESFAGSERGTQPSRFRANLKPPQQSNVSVRVETLGWQPTCNHDNAGTGRCIVLDPFFGSGTTGRVALKHGRACWGIELNPAYVEQSETRTNGVQTMMDVT